MKKWLLFLMLIVVVAIGAGIVYYKKWRNTMLRKKLPELVFLKSDSLYRIAYDDVSVDELEGEIIIKNLRLTPDTTYKKANDPELPHQLLQVQVPEVHITGVQTDQAVLSKEIIAGQIKFTNPVVTMFKNDRQKKDTAQDYDARPTTFKIYQVLLRGLEKIKVDTILLDNANYHICKWPDGDTLFSASNINAHLHHLNISDSTSTDTSRVLFAEKATVAVDKILIAGKGHKYNYLFKSIELNSAERKFSVKTVSFNPLLGEAAYMKAAKYQTDRIDFDFTGLAFNDMNIQEVLNGNLIADELAIQRATFKIFRDKSYPKKNISRVGHFPHQELLKLPVNIAFKKVIIHSGFIEYKEKSPQTKSSGVVAFHNISATLYNVTNQAERIKANPVFTLNFHCSFLDKAPLSATLKFYLNNAHGRFTVNGTVGATDATVFNTLSKPMALVEIKSGTVDRLDFNLNCNDYTGKGTVRLLYHDLKVKLLKMEDGQPGDFEVKKAASFIANIALTNDNPHKNKPVRIATVAHQRDIYASMFNLTWKSIFEGIQKTVGMPAKAK